MLIDSDVLIDHLTGERPSRECSGAWAFSPVTRYELVTGVRDGVGLEPELRSGRELRITQSIAQRAGKLYLEAKLPMARALVAATAIEHGMELVTHAVAELAHVAELQVRAPVLAT